MSNSSTWPINRTIRRYHSRSEWTRERWQWRGTQLSPKVQDWSLTIRWFSVISRTFVGEMQLKYSICVRNSNGFPQIMIYIYWHNGKRIHQRSQETMVQSQVESYQRLKKIVLDFSLLNTQHYKVWIKGKWSNPEKGVGVVAIEKGAFGSPSKTVGQLYIYVIYTTHEHQWICPILQKNVRHNCEGDENLLIK